jgi:hypothetical protein
MSLLTLQLTRGLYQKLDEIKVAGTSNFSNHYLRDLAYKMRLMCVSV